jgi:uncharacterized protein YqcC (DUF446 family)
MKVIFIQLILLDKSRLAVTLARGQVATRRMANTGLDVRVHRQNGFALHMTLDIMTLAMKELEDTLRNIESELRKLDLWETEQPPLHALQSQMPFCYDTLRLPQWLQWVFLPRCEQIVRTREDIPENSDIYTIAEYYFSEAGIEATTLLVHIRTFDELITAWNTPDETEH